MATGTALKAQILGKAVVTIAQNEGSDAYDSWSNTLPSEDAILLSVHFQDVQRHRVSENDVAMEPSEIGVGNTMFYDLRRNPRVVSTGPHRTVDFHIPRAAFEALEEEAHSPPTGDIRYSSGTPVDDERIHALAAALLPEFAEPNPLLVGYVATALVAHVAASYGDFVPIAQTAKGGLAPWQLRRAQDMLASNLEGSVELEAVARECGLSVSHFSRAFRNSIGLPPRRWVMKRRVETAKLIMRQGGASLGEIALRCGFADQSHFTRVFSRETGASPGQWRRAVSV
jgi:AraC family transcriptional regulator